LAGGTLRRGRCERCYDQWVRARPIGLGASCGACDDQRRTHLRHFEIGLRANAPGGRWVVLCHNCVAAAEALSPPARSVEALKMRLQRERRWGDRRAAAVGRPSYRDPTSERRVAPRRLADRRLLAAPEEVEAEVEEVEIEIEAEYETISDDQLVATEELTCIHHRVYPG
jgi:hypothetical protein